MFLFIPDYGSTFDVKAEKVEHLRQLWPVMGVNADYSQTPKNIIEDLETIVLSHNIGALIGVGLGAFFASYVGALRGLPFIAINPMIDPYTSLSKYRVDIPEDTLEAYSLVEFPDNGIGLILLDRADEELDSVLSYKTLKDLFAVKIFKGGSHEFEHTAQSLDEIEALIRRVIY